MASTEFRVFGLERDWLTGADLKVVTLDTIDKRLPEAADDPIAITDRRIKGLLKNNIALENISLIF